ncbi:MAG: transporter substrate-binding domain-containing protein [Clostridia bacterium]|nr:transporter substrate-binding domain-containing protein [Clostridia bacterium]
MKKIISFALVALMLVTVMLGATACSKKAYIGVQSGTTGQYFVDGDVDWDFPGIEGYTAKGFSNPGLAVADMKNGSFDYVVVDKAPALQLLKSVKGIKVIDIELTEEVYAFGVDKANSKLLADINSILASKQTEIKSIIDKYATGEGIVGIESATKDLSKKDSQLVVATNAAFNPFEWREGDKFYGIDIEIMKLVADELDMELVIEDMEFDSVVMSVGKNGIDVAAAALTVNDTRKESVNFTTTYYNAAQVLIVLEGNTAFDGCETADDVIATLVAENNK